MFPIVTIDMAILASNNAIGYRKLCIYVKNVILERVSAIEIPRTRKLATIEQRNLILAIIEESYADLTSILGSYWQSIYVWAVIDCICSQGTASPTTSNAATLDELPETVFAVDDAVVDAAAETVSGSVEPAVNFFPVFDVCENARSVLDNMIEKMEERELERYAPLLGKRKNLTAFLLWNNLRPAIKTLCNEGALHEAERVASLGGDYTSRSPGVYMHLMWLHGEGTPRKYVGQARDLQKRIVKEHMNPRYRKNYPSLHYNIWEKAQRHAWVILTVDGSNFKMPSESSGIRQLQLNMMEHWMALLFKSLPPRVLACYLPNIDVKLQESRHANVAVPLSQGDSKKSFSFALLAQSSDPITNEYYRGRMAEMRRKRNVEDEKKRKDLFTGVEQPCYTSPDRRLRFNLREVKVAMSLTRYDLKYSQKTINVRLELHDSVHPNRYALECRPEDDAMRLGICIKAKSSEGHDITIWPTAEGEKNAKRVNELVDWLEGVSADEIRSKPRRIFEGMVGDWRNHFETDDHGNATRITDFKAADQQETDKYW